MSYRVFILPRAQKELADLPPEQLNIAEVKINALRENPRPAGCKKLTERPAWRIRFGDYRIIYKIDDPEKALTIVSVGHRREIYR